MTLEPEVLKSPPEDLNRSDAENYEPTIQFEPVVNLPLIENVTLEEEENVIVKLRAKLYRFDVTETPSVWKERGTGEIKLLHHVMKNTVRIVMRRDKTLKICANHFITPSMNLQRPNTNRINWWMWSVAADFADQVSKPEIFAIKFASEEDADLWKEKFSEGQNIIQENVLKKSGEKGKNSASSGDSSDSETEELYDDALDKSNLSESVFRLNIKE